MRVNFGMGSVEGMSSTDLAFGVMFYDIEGLEMPSPWRIKIEIFQ